MLRRLSAFLAGALLCSLAFGQSVPNGGPVVTGQIWTAAQWNNAWMSKFDVTGGTLTAPTLNNPTITGGVQSAPAISNPTVTTGTFGSPAFTGTPTLNGTAFAPSATVDTTNASNISSGTLSGSRVAAINLAASGNGGVTGVLPLTNLNLAGSPTWTGLNTFSAGLSATTGAFSSALTFQGVQVPTYPRTAAEIAASITPVNFTFPAGNMLRYGADPTGATDNSAIFASAVAALGSAGGVVYVPAGTYLYQSSAFVTLPAGVTVQGAGRYASVITTSNPVANIFFVNGLGAGVKSIGFKSLTTQTGGIFVELAGINNTIEDFNFIGDFTAIEIIGAADKILNGTLNAGAGGAFRIVVNCGDASPTIDNVLFNGQSAPFPAFGIYVPNAVALTISNAVILQQGVALGLIVASGQLDSNITVSQSFFDSGTQGVEMVTSGTGNIGRVYFVNSWTGDSSIDGIFIDNAGTGIISGINLINHQAANNASGGVSINGPVTGVTIVGGTFAGNAFGIFDAATGDITISAAKIGAYEGLAGNTTDGLALASTVTTAIITGDSFNGNGTAVANSMTGGFQASNNVGYAPFSVTTSSIGGASLANGACSTGTVSVPGSTTSMSVQATPATFPGAGFHWAGYVSTAGTVTVEVCNATGTTNTPTASPYNVRVLN